MSDIRKHLEQQRVVYSRYDAAKLFYDFLLENGREYEIGPKTFAGERGEVGACYKNATHLAVRDRTLTYVEGKIAVYGVIVDHAWCVGSDGIAIDPTLAPALKDGTLDRISGPFFGVPFRTEYAVKASLQNGVYGLLDGYYARKTLPKLVELGLEAGQDWLLRQRKQRRKA